MKLNLGCGAQKKEGYVNVDCELNQFVKPDLKVDLNLTPWPWEDNSADEILAHHVLEHLYADPCDIMKEIYRVLKPQAECIVRVPHPRSDDYLNDPTHVRPYMPDTFGHFCRKFCEEWVAAGWSNTPLALFLGIDLFPKDIKLGVKPKWSQQFGDDFGKVIEAADMYNNVISEFQITLVKDGSNGDSKAGKI